MNATFAPVLSLRFPRFGVVHVLSSRPWFYCRVLFMIGGSLSVATAQRATFPRTGDSWRISVGDAAATDGSPGSVLEGILFRETSRPLGTFVATFSPYTHHTGKGPYNSRPEFRSLEWESPVGWSIGGASFQNSFSQPCWYAFGGKRFKLKHRSGRFFAKITAGIIYGYKPPHQDAVPVNWRGYCPAIIPSLGYQYKYVSFQLAVFGRNYGAMPMVGCDLR